MARAPAANLAVIPKRPAVKAPAPPTKLGKIGLALWRSVVENYVFDDPGSVEILHQACLAADRAHAIRVIVDREGELLQVKGGVRAHPLLRDEMTNRMFIVSSLSKLGLDLEPVKAMGRPAGLTFA